MDIISYTSVRKNLAKTMDRVNDNHTPIIITRQNGKSAVLLALDDFKSYEETAYLMRSPNNAARLDQSIQELEKGQGKERTLID